MNINSAENKTIADETTSDKQTRLTRSAGVVSIAVMGSRVLGLVREMVLTYFFEAKVELDAFKAAFRIPNLFRDLFGEGILSKAFVTIFTDTEVKKGEETAWRLTSLVFNALVIILGVITLLGILLAPAIVDLMFWGKGFDLPGKRDLTVFLTQVMFPFLPLVSLAAISMGLLNSKGRFFIPASASSFFNIGSVVVGIIGYYIAPSFGHPRVLGMAVGVLVGGAMQFVIQIPSIWRIGYRYRPILSFTDPSVRQVMRLVLPMILGVAAVQINVFADSIFASHGEGWLSWVNLAFRLMHLPIGVVGVAISTATLPMLSRHVAEGDMKSYRQTLSHSLRLILLLTIPASVGLMVLKEPIIRLIYQRGVFGSDDTIMVAGALFCYAFGLCGYSAVKVGADSFYALKDTRTPAFVSFGTIMLNIILNYLFIFHFGFDHQGLALSTSCTVTLNAILLFIILRRRIGHLDMGAVPLVFCKVMLASGAMWCVCWWISRQSENLFGTANILARLAQVGGSIAGGIIALYLACRVLRIKEMDDLIRAIRGRFVRR
ncbi:murein biosynthesis integral membrane protein MurJ [bacterium]|nr:murein biosynthesis integral membrane protein MurJ [bacterium]